MQGAMKGLCAVVLLAATTTAKSETRCPKIKEIDPETDILLPHEDCDKYYQCTHGIPVETPCPKNLFYSISAGVCEWRDSVDCEGRNVPEEVFEVARGDNDSVKTAKPDFPLGEFLPNGCPVNPKLPLLLPHESGCKVYYYCERGERQLRRCPVGLYFNKEHQICDWPWNVTCKRSTKQKKLLYHAEDYFKLAEIDMFH